MRPAFSVILLTTLIGAGQGLFLALYTVQMYSAFRLLPAQDAVRFYALGSAIALALLGAGLIASFFHLGHPERAWRSAARWRTSWLSREVIALPAVMFLVLAYGVMHYAGWDPVVYASEAGVPIHATLVVGAAGAAATVALFMCTGMIYACLKFLQEWHTPLTVINYILLGSASGLMAASAFSAYTAPGLTKFYGFWAAVLTVAALVSRGASLIRNARLKPKSTLQTALGVRHSRIVQKSMGFMGGSFNTREFFNGASRLAMRSMKWIFLMLVFPVPLALLAAGITGLPLVLVAAFLVQYLGLLAERWFFFAQANHPQNLYYQTI